MKPVQMSINSTQVDCGQQACINRVAAFILRYAHTQQRRVRAYFRLKAATLLIHAYCPQATCKDGDDQILSQSATMGPQYKCTYMYGFHNHHHIVFNMFHKIYPVAVNTILQNIFTLFSRNNSHSTEVLKNKHHKYTAQCRQWHEDEDEKSSGFRGNPVATQDTSVWFPQ